MKKLFNSKLLLQVIVASMVATMATAGIVGAATTIGSNVNTAGTLTATGATTIYGATSIGGAITATSTLGVTGVTTLTGNLILSTASSTGLVKVDSLQLGTVAITPTGTELNFVDGVTSALQTQLDTKSPLASPTFTGTAIFAAASSTGLVKVDSLQLGTVAITPTGTELNFVDGVTSAIQTQLDLKATLADPTFTGTVTIPTPFTLGAVSVLPTGTELNFVDGVTSAIQTQLNAKQSTTLADGTILVGNGTNVATAVTMSGDVTITNAGVSAIGAEKVTNAMIANAAGIPYSKLTIADADLSIAKTNGLQAALDLKATLASPTFTGQTKRSVQSGVTANVGSSQETGTVVTADIVEVTTVANIADAVTLPVAVAGMQITVINRGANALGLFPGAGGNINLGGLNLEKSVGANATVICNALGAVDWECNTLAR